MPKRLQPNEFVRIHQAVDRQRLIETALALCEIYSPTRSAGEVSDRLAELLRAEGFTVERPDGGWSAAPAVAVRFAAETTERAGPTLQFDGHLDTVHLPFVPPAVLGDRLTGSGAADMKAGVAAAVEALRVIRELSLLTRGAVLLTAHDLHEAPWGDGSQLEGIIRAGYCGDAVLIPEYQRDTLAVRGRGQAVLRIAIRRDGPPIHEVMRPDDQPNVIAVGAELVQSLMALDTLLAMDPVDPLAGRNSVFVGQVHAGEIYNQSPQSFLLEGTRRWLPGVDRAVAEAEVRMLTDQLAAETGTTIELEFFLVRDAFELKANDPLTAAFQAVIEASDGAPLPTGGKPFVDDGNTFWALRKIAAVTHGPRGGGAHTLSEWVSIDELARTAAVYAATAGRYCGAL